MPELLEVFDAFLLIDLVRLESDTSLVENRQEFVFNLIGSALLDSGADPARSFRDVTVRWKEASQDYTLPEKKPETSVTSPELRGNSLLLAGLTVHPTQRRPFVIACDDQHRIKLSGAFTVAAATAAVRQQLDPHNLVAGIDVEGIPGLAVAISRRDNPQPYATFIDHLKAQTGR